MKPKKPLLFLRLIVALILTILLLTPKHARRKHLLFDTVFFAVLLLGTGALVWLVNDIIKFVL